MYQNLGKEDNVYCIIYINAYTHTHGKYVYIYISIYTHTHINIYIYIDFMYIKSYHHQLSHCQARRCSKKRKVRSLSGQTFQHFFKDSHLSNPNWVVCLYIPKCPRILFGLKKTKDVGRVFFTVFCVELSETSKVGS